MVNLCPFHNTLKPWLSLDVTLAFLSYWTVTLSNDGRYHGRLQVGGFVVKQWWLHWSQKQLLIFHFALKYLCEFQGMLNLEKTHEIFINHIAVPATPCSLSVDYLNLTVAFPGYYYVQMLVRCLNIEIHANMLVYKLPKTMRCENSWNLLTMK